MIHSTTFFSVADARQYHCTYIDSSHRDALHDYIVSVLIGIFCLFTTLVFEINRDVSRPKFLVVVDMMRGFFVNTASDRLLVGTCGGVKVAPPPFLLVSNWKNNVFWK